MRALPDSEKRRARDRLAVVAFFADLISHRARNRLAMIRAALEILQLGREADMSPEFRSVLLQEMDRLLGDFNLGADMARSDFGRIETVSSRIVVGEAIAAYRPIASVAKLSFETDFAPPPDEAAVDRRLLRQVLFNLFRNADEALVGGDSPRISVRCSRGEGSVDIEVADNGPGVPAEIHERLFLEPVTCGEGRAGLGLSLCRDALAVMDGSIEYLTPKGRPHGRFRVSVRAAK